MLARKDYALIVGVALFCMGFFCLPVGQGASPKRDLSAFARFADTGTLLSPAALLIAAGLSIILLVQFIPALTATFRRLTRRYSGRRIAGAQVQRSSARR